MVQKIKCLKCLCPMTEVLTRKGVLIDVCPLCQGVWLDQGEWEFFTKDKKVLLSLRAKSLKNPQKIASPCPKCQSAMQRGRFSSFLFQVEKCLSCQGLFLDKTEFQKLSQKKAFSSIKKDLRVGGDLSSTSYPSAQSSRPSSSRTTKGLSSVLPIGMAKIPSLFWTTGAVCVSLYGLLFLVLVFLMESQQLSLLSGVVSLIVIVLAQFYFSPFVIDWQLKCFGSLDWVGLNQLPPAFKKSLLKLSAENRIPIPKMGIIKDYSPQAYTYGRTPKSARVVFSQGMFELLDSEEAEAVLAHELGHIKHWDFVVMTVIKVVPLLLYTVYRNIRTALEQSRNSKNKGKGGMAFVMVVSYVFYLISEYLVLFVSRVREYHADRFSAFATQKPNKLLTALVKIAYGLLNPRDSTRLTDKTTPVSEDSQKVRDKDRQEQIKAVEALNIMSVARSKQLALASQGEKNHFNPQVIKDIMRWDLWSPWAFYYELHSTHPLTAKRINALGSYALNLNQEPFLRFRKVKPESYWDDFLSDLFVLLLPYIMGLSGLLMFIWFKGWDWDFISSVYKALVGDPSGVEGSSLDRIALVQKGEGEIVSFPIGLFLAGILGLSIGAFLRLICAYPFGRFAKHSVSSLLKMIKVSPVRSYPVSLVGYIIGRGEAGNIFSEDLVFKDKTGLIYLNHEPFGLNILFALFRYKKFQGQLVKVRGWYRRSPSPYIEVRNIQTADTKSAAYTYHYKMAFCIIGILLPLIYFL